MNSVSFAVCASEALQQCREERGAGLHSCLGLLQLDLDLLDVGELHAPAVRPAVVGAEVHPSEAVGRDLLELLLGGALAPAR